MTSGWGPHVRWAYRMLLQAFGPIRPEDYRGNPLDELVLTILSQSTTDANARRAFEALRKRFPRWEQVADASGRDIARAIRHGGLANVKSKTIRNALRLIREREGKVSLARFKRMEDADIYRYLVSIHGVGPKTAGCVLMFALGRPFFPVDTHVYRVTRRLGWLEPHVPPAEASDALKPAIPDGMVLPLHLYLIWHGRKTCRAQRPRCGECRLRGRCRHGRILTVATG